MFHLKERKENLEKDRNIDRRERGKDKRQARQVRKKIALAVQKRYGVELDDVSKNGRFVSLLPDLLGAELLPAVQQTLQYLVASTIDDSISDYRSRDANQTNAKEHHSDRVCKRCE